MNNDLFVGLCNWTTAQLAGQEDMLNKPSVSSTLPPCLTNWNDEFGTLVFAFGP